MWTNQAEITPQSGYVTCARFSPDCTKVAFCTTTGFIEVRNPRDLSEIVIKQIHTKSVNEIRWSEDSQLILSCSDDGTLVLSTGSTLMKVNDFRGHHSYVLTCDISTTNLRIASGSYDESVRIWDASSGKCLKFISAHSEPVSSVSFSRDGSFVISSSWDGIVRQWDTFAGTCIKAFNVCLLPISFSILSPNDQYVLASSNNSTIKLIRISDGATMAIFRGHENSQFGLFTGFTISEDGRAEVFSPSESGDIVGWDLNAQDVTWRVPLQNAGPTLCADVSRRGRALIAAGSTPACNTVYMFTRGPENEVEPDVKPCETIEQNQTESIQANNEEISQSPTANNELVEKEKAEKINSQNENSNENVSNSNKNDFNQIHLFDPNEINANTNSNTNEDINENGSGSGNVIGNLKKSESDSNLSDIESEGSTMSGSSQLSNTGQSSSTTTTQSSSHSSRQPTPPPQQQSQQQRPLQQDVSKPIPHTPRQNESLSHQSASLPPPPHIDPNMTIAAAPPPPVNTPPKPRDLHISGKSPKGSTAGHIEPPPRPPTPQQKKKPMGIMTLLNDTPAPPPVQQNQVAPPPPQPPAQQPVQAPPVQQQQQVQKQIPRPNSLQSLMVDNPAPHQQHHKVQQQVQNQQQQVQQQQQPPPQQSQQQPQQQQQQQRKRNMFSISSLLNQ